MENACKALKSEINIDMNEPKLKYETHRFEILTIPNIYLPLQPAFHLLFTRSYLIEKMASICKSFRRLLVIKLSQSLLEDVSKHC